jgi:hypothetical protein
MRSRDAALVAAVRGEPQRLLDDVAEPSRRRREGGRRPPWTHRRQAGGRRGGEARRVAASYPSSCPLLLLPSPSPLHPRHRRHRVEAEVARRVEPEVAFAFSRWSVTRSFCVWQW